VSIVLSSAVILTDINWLMSLLTIDPSHQPKAYSLCSSLLFSDVLSTPIKSTRAILFTPTQQRTAAEKGWLKEITNSLPKYINMLPLPPKESVLRGLTVCNYESALQEMLQLLVVAWSMRSHEPFVIKSGEQNSGILEKPEVAKLGDSLGGEQEEKGIMLVWAMALALRDSFSSSPATSSTRCPHLSSPSFYNPSFVCSCSPAEILKKIIVYYNQQLHTETSAMQLNARYFLNKSEIMEYIIPSIQGMLEGSDNHRNFDCEFNCNTHSDCKNNSSISKIKIKDPDCCSDKKVGTKIENINSSIHSASNANNNTSNVTLNGNKTKTANSITKNDANNKSLPCILDRLLSGSEDLLWQSMTTSSSDREKTIEQMTSMEETFTLTSEMVLSARIALIVYTSAFKRFGVISLFFVV
jgi:hypothetical protein